MFAQSALKEMHDAVDSSADESPRTQGRRCDACGRTSALALVRCPRCASPMVDAQFGPEGVVWSSTVVHLDGMGPSAPYQLAYLDLDDGPRVLVQVDGDGDGGAAPVAVGTRLRLIGSTPAGDPVATIA